MTDEQARDIRQGIELAVRVVAHFLEALDDYRSDNQSSLDASLGRCTESVGQAITFLERFKQ